MPEMEGFGAMRRVRRRPAQDRAMVVRAFLAKAVFHTSDTRALLDRLAHDPISSRQKAAKLTDAAVALPPIADTRLQSP